MKEYDVKNPVHFLALGFGSGLIKPAPGTWGTLASLPVYYFGLTLLGFYPYLVVLLVSSLLGIYLCGKAAADVGKHDDGAIVWDEFVGMWITLTPVSWMWTSLNAGHWVWMLVGFVLFRFFDIVKPFPVGFLDRRVKGGLGIMLDDILAGLMALASLQLVIWCYARLYLGLQV